jgi:hypothetical protein
MIRLLPVVALLALAAPAFAQEFFLRIEHRFGTAVIEAPPERVWPPWTSTAPTTSSRSACSP